MADVPPLVGRDEGQARLLDALQRCTSGTGGLVLVSGEAGIGKSRLLRHVLLGWRGRRLSGTAVAGDRAYGPFARLLVAHRGAPPDGSRSRYEEAGPEAILDLLRRTASAEPTVVVLEDLHLADAASIELIPVVAETLAAAPVLVLATYRTDALPRAHPLRAMRTELRRAGHLVDIALRPLTEHQTGQVLAALLGGPPSSRLVSAVHHRAEGLPFFVEEIAAALVDRHGLVGGAGGVDLVADSVLPLPESVRDAVMTRTADPRDRHGAAVGYAATLGVMVDPAALASLTVPAEVDALLEAGLLLEVDGEIGAFRHALVREALYRAVAVQMRHRGTLGKAYHDRKRAAGKRPSEAMRCLMRRLSDVGYRQLVNDAVEAEMAAMNAGREGAPGRLPDPARPARPAHRHFGQALPGPATTTSDPATTHRQVPITTG